MLRNNFSGVKLGTRWIWLKYLNSPEEVTDGHIRTVYRLDKPVCPIGKCDSTCKSSPLCLNGLGQLKRSHVSNTDGIENTTSDEPFRNGLKNYGNTCYLNAFLQLYFRFGKLRQAVYALPAENDETGIIYQLQVIFSQLQLSNSGVVDPGGLIEALRLCEEEQQDAPEFHCLFMNLLEARFRESGLSIVDDLFRGELVYETRCLNCGFTSKQPSKFLELSLKVSSNSLVGCITDYLKEESLVGENQYACSHCGGKRDGVRRVYITRAPSLLCVQLLRFTYDPRTGQRKKPKATIRLPDSLELTPLTQSSSATQSDHSVACLIPELETAYPRTYQLCGVLLHIGTQPTSGHYIAVVRDSVHGNIVNETDRATSVTCDDGSLDRNTEYWTVCNDMEVCSIPAHQFNLARANGSSNAMQTCRNVNSSTGPTDTVSGGLTNSTSLGKRMKKATSNRTKRSRLMMKRAASYAEPISSSEVAVGSVDSDTNSTESSSTDRKPSVQWHSSPNAYMLFYQSVEDPQPPSNEISVPIHLRKMVEEVNLIKSQAIQDEQALQVSRRERLQDLMSELWPPDTPTVLSTSASDSISLVPTQWLISWFDHPDQPPLMLHPSRVPVAYSPESSSATTSVTDDLESLSRSKSESDPSTVSRTSSFSYPVCPHNRIPIDLDPYVFRAVSTTGLRRLLEDAAPEWKKLNIESLQPCRCCVRLKVALSHLKRSIKEISKSLDVYPCPQNETSLGFNTNISGKESEPGHYWIGRRSLLQWRILARDYVKALYANEGLFDRSAVQPKAVSTKFNADVLCPHGKLRTNSKSLRRLPAPSWHRLVALFPGAVIPTFPVLPEVAPDGSTCLLPNYKCIECETLEASVTQRALKERQLLTGVVTPNARRLSTSLPSNHLGNEVEIDEARIHSILTDCFSPRKSSGQLLGVTHLTAPLSEHGQLASNYRNGAPYWDSQGEELDIPNSQAVYLIPMDFVNRWRRFIRNPSPDAVPKYLPSGLNGSHVLCPHGKLSMPWWNLMSDGLLCPLNAQEWAAFRQCYPSLNASTTVDYEARDDLTDEEGEEQAEVMGDCVIEDEEEELVTVSSFHSIKAYPPLYLVPSSSEKPEWQLYPSQYAQVCATCHAKILTERNSYQNARFRVRLVQNAEEALLDTTQGFPTDTDLHEDDPTPSLTEPPIATDQANKVGGDGDIWHPRVLRVDAKLVFGPHVQLSRVVLGCLLLVPPVKSDSTEDAPSDRLMNHQSIEVNAATVCTQAEAVTTAATPPTTPSHKSTYASTTTTNTVKWVKDSKSKARTTRHRVQTTVIRRSTRQRTHPNDLVVQGSSDQPLQHLKVQLMQLIGVTPADQHLMFKGVELLDHTKTLQDLGIHADSLLHLWTDTPPWNSATVQLDSSESMKRTAAPKPTVSPKPNIVPVELGFKGTRLLDN